MIKKIDEELINRINNIYWKYTIGPQIVKKPKDLAVLTSICAFGKNVNRGPIGVSLAKFNGKKITLITLGGTQIKEGQATRLDESKLSSYGKDNDYLTAVLKLFNQKNENGEYIISRDMPIILSGISLGGMIAQQLISKEEFLSNFNVLSIICFGSPLIRPFDRKGIRIIRFCDKGDIVPKLGNFTMGLKNLKYKKSLDKKEKILVNGKYKTMIESHALSYVECPLFDVYDFYGEKNGKNELEILDEIKFYEAPILNNDNNE